MTASELFSKLILEVENLIPEYRKNPDDDMWSKGNVAICLISEDGFIMGKVFGDDKGKQKHYLGMAQRKALQVWLTNEATGTFEKKIYSGELDESKYTIQKPEYIGWEGGIPLDFKGIKFAAGFSGFQGIHDIEIVKKAQDALKAFV